MLLQKSPCKLELALPFAIVKKKSGDKKKLPAWEVSRLRRRLFVHSLENITHGMDVRRAKRSAAKARLQTEQITPGHRRKTASASSHALRPSLRNQNSRARRVVKKATTAKGVARTMRKSSQAPRRKAQRRQVSLTAGGMPDIVKRAFTFVQQNLDPSFFIQPFRDRDHKPIPSPRAGPLDVRP